MSYPRPIVDGAMHDALITTVRASLDNDRFEVAWNEGSSLSLDDAVALSTRGRGAQARPRLGWSSLTPTEAKVVDLVAQGLTNPEIGERLFISRGTVKSHLAHVYAKTGQTTRAALAAYAASKGPSDLEERSDARQPHR